MKKAPSPSFNAHLLSARCVVRCCAGRRGYRRGKSGQMTNRGKVTAGGDPCSEGQHRRRSSDGKNRGAGLPHPGGSGKVSSGPLPCVKTGSRARIQSSKLQGRNNGEHQGLEAGEHLGELRPGSVRQHMKQREQMGGGMGSPPQRTRSACEEART